VDQAGVVNALPMSRSEYLSRLEVEGYQNEKDQTVDMRRASPGYFQTMDIRLIEGRIFDESDNLNNPASRVVVNQAFVKHYFASQSLLGRHIKVQTPHGAPSTIIGVVSDVKHGSLEETPRPEVFGSIWQFGTSEAFVVVQASGSREALAAAMRQTAQLYSPSLDVVNIRSVEELICEANARRRFQTSLLSIFAAIALLLALVGIYGLTTYSVKQRTPELGIRMTLGASRVQILGMVLRQGVGLTAIGVMVGIGGALALTRVLAASLYGVKATDPITFYAVPVLILLVSAAACLIPAWKATRIDPAIALRYE
jgi:predicted permease